MIKRVLLLTAIVGGSWLYFNNQQFQQNTNANVAIVRAHVSQFISEHSPINSVTGVNDSVATADATSDTSNSNQSIANNN